MFGIDELSADVRTEIQQKRDLLLVERLRVALWILIVGNGVFAIDGRQIRLASKMS